MENTMQLTWNTDHYDVVIPALGNNVQTTGKTREEALDKGRKIIEKMWIDAYMKPQEAKTA